jgi:hypothetical protein
LLPNNQNTALCDVGGDGRVDIGHLARWEWFGGVGSASVVVLERQNKGQTMGMRGGCDHGGSHRKHWGL